MSNTYMRDRGDIDGDTLDQLPIFTAPDAQLLVVTLFSKQSKQKQLVSK